VYQQRRNPLIAADYVWQHGLRPQLATIVADTSRLTAKSVWNVLGGALTYGLFKRRTAPYAVYTQSVLLTEEACAGFPDNAISHPWVESAAEFPLPPSKVQQVLDIVDTQHFYLRPYRFVDTLHPLISQPIIECCLTIPTYVLTHGGVDRALAREAFRDELPPEIAARTAKGGTTGYFNRLAVENAQFLREYLLDGMLVSAGILNKQELELQLSEQVLIRGERLYDIFTAARTEAWLRSWAGVWRKAAA
jgi:asparagine synthase (glutamine-hydrolysing)